MTIKQLNRIRLDSPSFRIYVALLSESNMTINKLASKTGITWKTISKKVPKLLSKGLATKTNHHHYSGIDLTMENNPTVVENDIGAVRENDLTVVENDRSVVENDPTTQAIYDKYS